MQHETRIMRYFISDHHFGHENIIRYCDRPFSCADEMDRHMVERWNATVKPEDEVFYVGDFSFRSVEETEAILAELHGTKILIMGNHDRRTAGAYTRMGFAACHQEYRYVIPEIGRSVTLAHHPSFGPKAPQILIHGHSHTYRPVVTTYITTRQLLINVSVEGLSYEPISEEKVTAIIQQHDNFFATSERTI